MVDVQIYFTDGIVGLGGASVEPWKRQVERGPKVPGRKGSDSTGYIVQWGSRSICFKCRHFALLRGGTGWSHRLPDIAFHSEKSTPASAIVPGSDCIWACISRPFTCLGFNHLTPDPESLASDLPWLLMYFPSNQFAARSQPSTACHWNDSSYR